MNEEEIRRRILKELGENKTTGILNQELMKILKIRENTAQSGTYYDVLKELEKDELIARAVKKVKGKTCIYLPEFKSTVFKYRKIDDKTTRVEIMNIECGFFIIEQGVFTQRKGALLQFKKGYVFDKLLTHSGLLDRFVGTEDNSDFLYFWVENGNNNAIEDVVVRILVPPLFFKPMKPKEEDCYNCRYNLHYYNINIICDELMGREKGMPNDRAYILIPLKRQNEHLLTEFDKEEQIPTVKVRYKDVPIRHIKGAEVTADTTKGKIILLEE